MCYPKLQRYELAPGITSEQASSCFTPFSFPAFLCLAFELLAIAMVRHTIQYNTIFVYYELTERSSTRET